MGVAQPRSRRLGFFLSVRVLVCIGSRSGLGDGGAVLAAVKDAARRYAVACGDP